MEALATNDPERDLCSVFFEAKLERGGERRWR